VLTDKPLNAKHLSRIWIELENNALMKTDVLSGVLRNLKGAEGSFQVYVFKSVQILA